MKGIVYTLNVCVCVFSPRLIFVFSYFKILLWVRNLWTAANHLSATIKNSGKLLQNLQKHFEILCTSCTNFCMLLFLHDLDLVLWTWTLFTTQYFIIVNMRTLAYLYSLKIWQIGYPQEQYFSNCWPFSLKFNLFSLAYQFQPQTT